MSKYKLMIAALAVNAVASAQNLEQQLPQMQELQQLSRGGINHSFNPQRYQLDISNLELKVPSQYNEHDRTKVLSLLTELKQACPACSTGITIGGGTVIGGNTDGTGTPLFPIQRGNIGGLNPLVTITKTEYDELKMKADLYDRIIVKSEGQ